MSATTFADVWVPKMSEALGHLCNYSPRTQPARKSTPACRGVTPTLVLRPWPCVALSPAHLPVLCGPLRTPAPTETGETGAQEIKSRDQMVPLAAKVIRSVSPRFMKETRAVS